MKEKRFLKWLILRTIGLLVIYILVSGAMSLVMDRTLVMRSDSLTFDVLYATEEEPVLLDDYVWSLDDEGLITLKYVEQREDGVYFAVEPTGNGAGETVLSIIHTQNEVLGSNEIFKVSKSGLIVETQSANFSHYRERQVCMILLLAALSALLWIGFFKSMKELHFSYHSIFCIGLGIWCTVITGILIVKYYQNVNMLNLYNTLQAAASRFSLLTFPLTLVFAVSLTISNISLIRHEGFHFTNLLGILLSVTMVFGLIFLVFFDALFPSGSQFQINLWSTFIESLQTIYALLECFLIGSIICGTIAAKKNPAYDKDYIVILGCMIREDGTLYPLSRGRVDRAIRFYREQLTKTGKKAVFIPSGGKGDDEPIAEGEAMKRYLIEQGIEEEQIMAETESINTKQNMEFSKALMEPGKKTVFSTTNYHVFRSGIIAGQAGLDTDGMGSPTKWYFWPNAYIREVVGMLSYKWKSLIILFIPIVAFLSAIRFSF